MKESTVLPFTNIYCGFLKKGVSVIPLDEFPITKLQLGKRLNNLLNPSDLIKVKLLLFFSSFFKIFY